MEPGKGESKMKKTYLPSFNNTQLKKIGNKIKYKIKRVKIKAATPMKHLFNQGGV
jgi:hypothetical protein